MHFTWYHRQHWPTHKAQSVITFIVNMRGQWPKGICFRLIISLLMKVYWSKNVTNQSICHIHQTTVLPTLNPMLKTSLFGSRAHFWGVKQVARPAEQHSRLCLTPKHSKTSTFIPLSFPPITPPSTHRVVLGRTADSLPWWRWHISGEKGPFSRVSSAAHILVGSNKEN